tara:strand:- start:2027 stop:2362 length:336 start_codon:yes stop_codon:yes gene_type:complete
MKNYEIVLLFSVGEDALTDQTIEKYKAVITENGGSIDRYEDWGPLKMAYDIDNENKARYILINFKANNAIIDQLNELIKFNDHILRHLILNTKEAHTEPSFMNKEQLKSAS